MLMLVKALLPDGGMAGGQGATVVWYFSKVHQTSFKLTCAGMLNVLAAKAFSAARRYLKYVVV